MTQVVLAAWSISVVLIFMPVAPVARLIGRRFRPASERPAPEPAAASPTGNTVPGVGPADIAVEEAASTRAEFMPRKLEEQDASLAAEEAPDAAAGEQEPPGPVRAADEEEPAPPRPQPHTLRNRALGLFGTLAMVALYGIFISSSIYILPRLLARVLDNEHPLAAITSQSMYPELKRGDLVLLEGVDQPADLSVGDILAFESANGFAIHRIIAIDGGTITTKGDANRIEDEPISFEQVIGRALTIRGRLAKIPYVGNFPLVFKQTEGQDAQAD